MPSTAERQLARIRARFVDRAHDLARVGFVIRGSVLQRFTRCASKGCRCREDPPQLHGPYWQWTTKVEGKTVTRRLKEEQVARYQEWIDNAGRVDEILQDLYDLSAEADRILWTLERTEPDTTKPRRHNPPKTQGVRRRGRRM